MISFDDIDTWEPLLSAELAPHAPEKIREQIAAARPRFLEDALDILLLQADRQAVIAATLAWIGSSTIAAYHGTRLTRSELDSVRTNGLLPLRAETRAVRLTRALSAVADGIEALKALPETLREYGEGEAAGDREHQVHLTLSRAGLTQSFNHYLHFGSEFDQQVAYALMGSVGKDLLARDGSPVVVEVEVPGKEALAAAHPYFDIDYMLATERLPNVVREFLGSWSHRQALPRFQSRSLRIDSGLIFTSAIPAAWIRSITPCAVAVR